MGRSPSRNEAERAAATKRLLDAATHLFATRGIAGTSMNAVVKEAGVSKGLAYHYFPSKEALVQAVVRRRIDHVGRIAAGLDPSLGPRDRVAALARAFVDDVLADPTGFRLQVRILAGGPDIAVPKQAADNRAAFAALFEAMGATDPAEEARFFTVAMLGVLTHLALSPDAADPDMLVRRLVALLPESP